MVRDEDTYPEETVVRIIKTGQFALIKRKTFLKDGKGFLHYLAHIDGKGEGLYRVSHQEIELENLPNQNKNGDSITHH